MLGSETFDQGRNSCARGWADGTDSIGDSGANVIHWIIERGEELRERGNRGGSHIFQRDRGNGADTRRGIRKQLGQHWDCGSGGRADLRERACSRPANFRGFVGKCTGEQGGGSCRVWAKISYGAKGTSAILC